MTNRANGNVNNMATTAGNVNNMSTGAGNSNNRTTAAENVNNMTTRAGNVNNRTTAAGNVNNRTTAAGNVNNRNNGVNNQANRNNNQFNNNYQNMANNVPTVVALQPNNNMRITTLEGLENISQALTMMSFNLLEITRELMGVVLQNSDKEINVVYNIALVKEIIGEIKRIKLDVEESLSSDVLDSVEYKALRTTVMYLLLNLKQNEIELVERVFTNLFSINSRSPDAETQTRCEELLSRNTQNNAERREKLLCLNTKTQIIAELMARISGRIRNMNSRERVNNQETPETTSVLVSSANRTRSSSQNSNSNANVPGVASNGSHGSANGNNNNNNNINRFLNTPVINNVATYFGNLNQEVRDRVHNVGAPVKSFMTDILRPNPVSQRNCLKDRRFPREPVEVLAQGTPAGAYEFHGVGTMLPKFAYTEVYNDNYY